MKISIVILNYNGKRHMERFLPSVVKHTTTADTEIVIADNCSTDDSISFLRSAYPQLRLIQLDKNYGFAGGYNKALEQIEAEYFILLNSDVEVTSGWVESLEKIMDERPEVAACQPKIMALNDRSRFEHAGACGG